MDKRKNILIILISAICFSIVGLLLIIAYENEKKDNASYIELHSNKLEDKYYENSNELGLTEDRGSLNSINRGLSKISNKDRMNKLVSSVLTDYYYLINEQKLDDAYNLLNKEYIEEFKVIPNVFKSINKDVEVTDYTITDISEPNLDGKILVKYLIKDENGYISKDMSIIEGKADYSITLNGLTETTKMSIEYLQEGIKSNIIKRYKIADRVAYKLVIENTNDKDIKIKMHPKGIYGVIQSNKYDHEIANTTQAFTEEDYVIKSGEIKSHIIMFNTNNYIEKIGFELVNGTKIEFNLTR